MRKVIPGPLFSVCLAQHSCTKFLRGNFIVRFLKIEIFINLHFLILFPKTCFKNLFEVNHIQTRFLLSCYHERTTKWYWTFSGLTLCFCAVTEPVYDRGDNEQEIEWTQNETYDSSSSYIPKLTPRNKVKWCNKLHWPLVEEDGHTV